MDRYVDLVPADAVALRTSSAGATAPQGDDEERIVKQRSKSIYELDRADYAWALGAMMNPPAGRGGYGLLVRAERVEAKEFLIRNHGMGIAEVGLVLSLVAGFSGAIGTVSGGYLADRLGRRSAGDGRRGKGHRYHHCRRTDRNSPGAASESQLMGRESGE